MLKITMHKGFHMTFNNGVTVSVQFGPGNYCENRDMPFDQPSKVHELASKTAEIAFWRAGGAWCTKEVFAAANKENHGDDVAGWVTPDELLHLMQVAASLN